MKPTRVVQLPVAVVGPRGVNVFLVIDERAIVGDVVGSDMRDPSLAEGV
jgi:hypothetical protein